MLAFHSQFDAQPRLLLEDLDWSFGLCCMHITCVKLNNPSIHGLKESRNRKAHRSNSRQDKPKRSEASKEELIHHVYDPTGNSFNSH